jgi:hypothetical protein
MTNDLAGITVINGPQLQSSVSNTRTLGRKMCLIINWHKKSLIFVYKRRLKRTSVPRTLSADSLVTVQRLAQFHEHISRHFSKMLLYLCWWFGVLSKLSHNQN